MTGLDPAAIQVKEIYYHPKIAQMSRTSTTCDLQSAKEVGITLPS